MHAFTINTLSILLSLAPLTLAQTTQVSVSDSTQTTEVPDSDFPQTTEVPDNDFPQTTDVPDSDATQTVELPISDFPLTTDLPVSDFLQDLYGNAVPTAATGALATSLASALYSAERAMTTNGAYAAAEQGLIAAIATLTNVDEIESSLASMGPLNPAFTTQNWYTAYVPTSVQSNFATIINDLLAVQTSVLNAGAAAAATGANATSTGATNATSRSTMATITSSTTSAASGTTSATTSTSRAGAQGGRATQMAVAGIAVALAAGLAVVY